MTRRQRRNFVRRIKDEEKVKRQGKGRTSVIVNVEE